MWEIVKGATAKTDFILLNILYYSFLFVKFFKIRLSSEHEQQLGYWMIYYQGQFDVFMALFIFMLNLSIFVWAIEFSLNSLLSQTYKIENGIITFTKTCYEVLFYFNSVVLLILVMINKLTNGNVSLSVQAHPITIIGILIYFSTRLRITGTAERMISLGVKQPWLFYGGLGLAVFALWSVVKIANVLI